MSSSALPYPSLDLILLSLKTKEAKIAKYRDHLNGRLTLRAGAMAEQGKPLEEILLAAKEVNSTLMRRFFILEYQG